MALTQLAPPYPIFTDKGGDPLDNGYLYFGEVNKNPETNPIQVYYDSAFTQPAAQPLRTSNGYVMRNGSPALIYADNQFSVTIRDKNNALVIYSPVGYGIDPGSITGIAVYDDFTGDGVTVNFTLSASPSTKNATNVYIDGVYQSKDNYSTSGTTLTFSTAPPLNSAIEVVSQESSIIGGSSAQQITYDVGGAGSQQRTVRSKLQEFVSVKDFGAAGDGVTDDTAAIQAAVTAQQGKSLYFPSGIYVNTSNPAGADDVLMMGEPFTTFSGTKLPLHNPIFTGNKQVALVAAVLRYYTTADGVPSDGWYLIQAKSGANHDPVLLGPVTASGAGSLNLDVDFDEFGIDPNIWTPSGFVCGPDETFTADGVIFGASVGTTSVTITGSFVGDRNALITWTTDGAGGGTLTGSNAPYIFTVNADGIVSGWVGSGANRLLRLYRDAGTQRKAYPSAGKLPVFSCRRSASSIAPVFCSFKASGTTTVGSNSYEYFDVFVDQVSDGTQITDATNQTFAFVVSDPGVRPSGFVFNQPPPSGSNIWMVGVFTRKEADYP